MVTYESTYRPRLLGALLVLSSPGSSAFFGFCSSKLCSRTVSSIAVGAGVIAIVHPIQATMNRKDITASRTGTRTA